MSLGRRYLWVKKPNYKFYLDILTHLKILELKEIQIFLPVHFYLRLQVDNFYTVHYPDHIIFRYVETFKLSSVVSQIKAFYLCIVYYGATRLC
jgi:hypothetical protein